MMLLRGDMMNEYMNYYNRSIGKQYSTEEFTMNDWNPGIYMNQTPYSDTKKEKKNSILYNPYEGFAKGNLFKDLYKSYKGVKPKILEPKTEKMELLSYISTYAFAVHELNLYLDNDPFNQEILEKYKKYVEELKKATKEYEKIYGPLTVTGVKQKDWTWVNDPWPWENN